MQIRTSFPETAKSLRTGVTFRSTGGIGNYVTSSSVLIVTRRVPWLPLHGPVNQVLHVEPFRAFAQGFELLDARTEALGLGRDHELIKAAELLHVIRQRSYRLMFSRALRIISSSRSLWRSI